MTVAAALLSLMASAGAPVAAPAPPALQPPSGTPDSFARRARFGTTSLTLTGRILRGGDLLTDADLHYVGVSADGHEKQPLPPWLRAALEPYAA